MTEPGPAVTQRPAGADSHDSPPESSVRSFRAWAYVGTFGVLAVMVAIMLHKTGGHFVYVIDDPAIHLGIADRLAHSGTWGISPGVYQSASSSPLWTVLLAGFSLVLPRQVMNLMPLLLNMAAAVWIIDLLARNQTLLRPSRRRLVDAVAVGAVAAVVLFLPGLAVVGMEHTLHAALLLQAMVLLDRSADADWASEPGTARPFALAVGLLFLAGFTRFETVFVGVAVGLALLALAVPSLARRTPPPTWRRQLPRAAVAGAATVLPVAIYGAINRLFSQHFLPNSVEAKTALAGRSDAPAVTFAGAIQRLATDPIVLAGAVLALVYLIWTWTGGGRRAVFPATVVLVTASLHSAYASYGWYERYQAYVIVLVLWFVLQAGAEVLTERSRALVPAVLVLVALLLAPVKWQLIGDAPVASQNTYRQRYAAAQFLERYYDHVPIATGELGYIGWYHHGPVTDVLGLGDFDVLQSRNDKRDDAAYWEELIRKRGVRIVAVYPGSLGLNTPRNWILVGTWQIGERLVTAVDRRFQFWAPTPGDVDRIRDELIAFQPDMAPGTTLEITPLLDFRKQQVEAATTP